MAHDHPRCRLGAPVLIGVLICLVIACGKKGPPVAPESLPPAAASDLKYEAADGVVQLSWTVPDTGAGRPDRFRVYRARQSSGCPSCPLSFAMVADIPASKHVFDGRRMTFSEPVNKGMIYFYKVITVSPDGITSDPSPVLRIEP